MEKLRLPILIAAMIFLTLAFLLQIGASGLATFLAGIFDPEALRQASQAGVAPGVAIRNMALFDSLLLYTVVLIFLPLIITHSLHARVQGIVTSIVSIVILILSILMTISALMQLTLMVSLLFSPIFGTIAYFSLYAAFPVNTSRGILALIELFKLGFAVCLVFAHQRFLQNRSLVILTLVSLFLGLVVGFLHGIVPQFLVSITDAIAAIMVAVIALIWAIKYLVGGITSISRAIG